MQFGNIMKMLKRAYVSLFAIMLTAGPSLGLTVDMAAVEAQWIPPGAATPVAMWKFINSGACPSVTPVDWDVGPVIDVPAGQDLTINLLNCLDEDVSIFVPGQIKATEPVIFTDSQGRNRVHSFDRTTAPGQTGSYTWVNPGEGTYLYQSGTFVARQIPKGLYGALVVRGASYPAADQEEILLYSEIDPDLNNSAAGARINNYLPGYFLINGDTYPATEDISISLGEDVLFRFINAGLQGYMPTLQGPYMSIIAEDGNLYPYPFEQYHLDLHPAKTIDVLVNTGTEGRYALYDRALHLTNGRRTNDSGGGMLLYIQAGTAAGAPVAVNDNYSIAEDTLLTAAVGDLVYPAVLDNDMPGTGENLTATLESDVSFGTLTLDADGSFIYTPNPDFNGNDLFTYIASDGINNSNEATAVISVTSENDPPAAEDDVAVTTPDTAAVIDVVANDLDIDGNLDPSSVLVVSLPANGTTTGNEDGTVTYIPDSGFLGSDSFDYQVCDTALECATATVIVTVEDALVENIAPTANDDYTETSRNNALIIDVVANDTDSDGTIDPATVDIVSGTTTAQGGEVVNNGDGTVTYNTPRRGFRGTDSFDYTVRDNDGAVSNVARVRINIL